MHMRKFTVFLFLAFFTFVSTMAQGFNDLVPDAVDKPATQQQNTSTSSPHSNTMMGPKHTVLGMVFDSIKRWIFGNPQEPHLTSDQGAPAQVQNQETITTPEPQEPKRKATIVFDIDHTLCVRFLEGHPRSEKRLENAIKQIETLCPECFVGFFTYTGDTYSHFFYPYFGEVFIWILQQGWELNFFSAGIKERNEELIPQFLKHVLKPFVTDSEKFYQEALNVSQFRIFSRGHLRSGSRHFLPPEEYGEEKKDLAIVSDDLANTILVDDYAPYVLGRQYPFIQPSRSASSKFSIYLGRPHEILENSFNFSRKLKDCSYYNAYYILGILYECKALMDQQRTISLKEALKLVITDGEYHPSKATPEHPKFDEWVIKGYEVAKTINPILIHPLLSFRNFRESFKEDNSKEQNGDL